MLEYYFQWFVFWLSYLVFPWLLFIALAFWSAKKSRGLRILLAIVFVFSGLFVYMRFVEPYMIVVRHEALVVNENGQSFKMAIVSDIHLGVYKDEIFLRRIVSKINEENPDFVIIPGDFINDPTPEQMEVMFAPFIDLKMPVYAVTGNHDAKVPGMFSSEEVRRALAGLVRDVDNKIDVFEKSGKKIRIYGLSDLMEGRSDYSVLESMDDAEFNLLLTHNPDSAYAFPGKYPIDLMVSGHTHGGQINFPPLFPWVIPCEYPFVRGWYEVGDMSVYVTSGVGEVMLPLRFLVPPEIVIMDVVF